MVKTISKLRLVICRGGKYDLTAVFSVGPEQDQTTVRWCGICGAVVIDTGADERVNNPGGYMKMRFPRIARLLWGLE